MCVVVKILIPRIHKSQNFLLPKVHTLKTFLRSKHFLQLFQSTVDRNVIDNRKPVLLIAVVDIYCKQDHFLYNYPRNFGICAVTWTCDMSSHFDFENL